jgi:acyl-coenzyme A thioesterase PaaI-like protein
MPFTLQKDDKSASSNEEVRTFHSLGYPDVCHGGIVATILDEAMGILLSIYKNREEEVAKARGKTMHGPATVTAELTVRYLKPVMTPQTICVIVELAKVEGRKIWLHGTIQDGSGLTLVKGTGLFVQTARHML